MPFDSTRLTLVECYKLRDWAKKNPLARMGRENVQRKSEREEKEREREEQSWCCEAKGQIKAVGAAAFAA